MRRTAGSGHRCPDDGGRHREHHDGSSLRSVSGQLPGAREGAGERPAVYGAPQVVAAVVDDRAVLRLVGEWDHETLDTLRAELAEFLRGQTSGCVLDVSGLTHLSCATARVVTAAVEAAGRDGCVVSLRARPGCVADLVLDVLGVPHDDDHWSEERPHSAHRHPSDPLEECSR